MEWYTASQSGVLPITLRLFDIGQGVLVRAAVAAIAPGSVVLNVRTTKGLEFPIEVAHSEIFLPESTDAAVDAMRLFLERLDATDRAGQRLRAELYELGAHATTATKKSAA